MRTRRSAVALGLACLVGTAGADEIAVGPVDMSAVALGRDEAVEGDAPEDFVVNDDLVVQGKACVGGSCADGEPFATEDLRVKADTPEIRLAHVPISGTSRNWAINADDTLFRVLDQTSGVTPFSIRNGAPTFSLNIFANGTVAAGSGVLASQPATLQVRRTDATARLLVEEASATTASRNLLRIINNGASTFRFDNSASGQSWGFGALGSGNFFIGSTPGQPLGFTLTSNGDVTLTGTLTQGSDRATKQAIAPLDPAALLERLARLPLSSWEYKGQDGVRHVGPMAQDFAAAFGLGADDRHIAPGDMAGVGLAAIQALKAENNALRAAQATLAEQVAALAAELRALRAQRP